MTETTAGGNAAGADAYPADPTPNQTGGAAAQQPDAQDFSKVPPDSLIVNVEQKLGQDQLPEDLVVVVGILGNSPRKDYKRLYLTLQLNDYVEFSNNDVVAYRAVKVNEVSGLIVWFRRETSLKHGRVETIDLQRMFLQGDISNSSILTPNAPGPSPSPVSQMCAGGSYLCGGGSYLCGGGSYLCGGGSYLCGGGSYLCGGGSYLCGGGGLR